MSAGGIFRRSMRARPRMKFTEYIFKKMAQDYRATLRMSPQDARIARNKAKKERQNA